jgi:hypothetical protein
MPTPLEGPLSPAWDPSSRTPTWNPSLASTPMPTPLEGPLSPAWDPSSGTPTWNPSPAPTLLTTTEFENPGMRPLCTPRCSLDIRTVGKWLLDNRLLHKRLDVRIRGTAKTLFHNGRYENQSGFTVMTQVPSSVNESLTVKLGYEQTKRKFKLCYLFPEMTTEIPRVVAPDAALPVVSSIGQRVVIIGPFLGGSSDMVGNYALIEDPMDSSIKSDLGLARVCSSGEWSGIASYFPDTSLCRSLPGVVEWEGSLY